MGQSIKRFVIMLKLGKVNFPKVIDVLNEIREDRAVIA